MRVSFSHVIYTNKMVKDNYFNPKRTINCKGKIINLSSPVVMGIINIASDSFYDGGKYKNRWEVLKQSEKLLYEGAAIIDLGAASTRPGAKLVSPVEEQKNILPVLESILKNFSSAIISVDTYNSSTASAVIENGAHIINDISAGSFDPKMFDTIAQYNVPYIMMHIKGTPETMQKNPFYHDVVEEITGYFSVRTEKLKQLGVRDIIIDPGFGFGKTVEHNYELLNKLDYFKIFELPLMVGLSRKSMINKVLNVQPDGALNGTTALNTIALTKGAHILRVHDAKPAVEAIKLVEKYRLLQ